MCAACLSSFESEDAANRCLMRHAVDGNPLTEVLKAWRKRREAKTKGAA